MTIFDIIASILFDKRKDRLSSMSDESVFAPFIVNRWLSMYSPTVALKCNIVNKYLTVFENKIDLFNLFVGVFPRVKPKRINYFKKPKNDNINKDEDRLNAIAKNYQVSKREILENIDLLQQLNKL